MGWEPALNSVDLIEEAIPSARGGHLDGVSRGPKPIPGHFREAVQVLAEYWHNLPGRRFTRQYHKGEPLTDGLIFVHKVIELLWPNIIKKLPSITKGITFHN